MKKILICFTFSLFLGFTLTEQAFSTGCPDLDDPKIYIKFAEALKATKSIKTEPSTAIDGKQYKRNVIFKFDNKEWTLSFVDSKLDPLYTTEPKLDDYIKSLLDREMVMAIHLEKAKKIKCRYNYSKKAEIAISQHVPLHMARLPKDKLFIITTERKD